MNEAVKKRSLLILEALEGSANECEALATETVQMILRGDYDRQIPPQVRGDLERIRDAVEEIKLGLVNLTAYVNRIQETHRL